MADEERRVTQWMETFKECEELMSCYKKYGLDYVIEKTVDGWAAYSVEPITHSNGKPYSSD